MEIDCGATDVTLSIPKENVASMDITHLHAGPNPDDAACVCEVGEIFVVCSYPLNACDPAITVSIILLYLGILGLAIYGYNVTS